MTDGPPRGASIVEVLVALLVGAVVVHLALHTAAVLARTSRDVEQRSDEMRATVLAEVVLRDEIRRGAAVVSRDSIRLRAMRGIGVPCGRGPGPAEVVVAWRGARRPQPTKDSVEYVSDVGRRGVVDLLRATASTVVCDLSPDWGSVLVLQTDSPLPGSTVLIRVFEPGSYHLGDATLRYRSGRGGRQPLTAPAFQGDSSSFTQGHGTVRLELAPASGRHPGVGVHLDQGRRRAPRP